MKQCNVIDLKDREKIGDPLTELLRSGAKQLIKEAVESELKELLKQHEDRKLPDGKAAVTRNGYLPEREIQTGIGPVNVRIPKVRSKDGTPVVFHSALVPPYLRKTKNVEEAIPWLYLKGVSEGEIEATLKVLFGEEKLKGFSAPTVSRLKKVWASEYKDWKSKKLDGDKWVYIWADGVHSGIRKSSEKLCSLVIIGVNERGEKHFLAIEDGVRELTQSWKDILLDLKSRGLNSPELAIGDGAMGFWAAMDEVYPQTRHQRCWFHKTGNILNYLPKATQPRAKDKLHNIWQAETKEEAEKAFDLFLETYGAKYPKATNCLMKDREELLAFYDFPAKHWQSIRTSNPIESTFGTIRHRTKQSKGCLSRDSMLHMMFKLGECAEKKWRRLRGFSYLAKVITGVKFKNGTEVTKSSQEVA